MHKQKYRRSQLHACLNTFSNVCVCNLYAFHTYSSRIQYSLGFVYHTYIHIFVEIDDNKRVLGKPNIFAPGHSVRTLRFSSARIYVRTPFAVHCRNQYMYADTSLISAYRMHIIHIPTFNGI